MSKLQQFLHDVEDKEVSLESLDVLLSPMEDQMDKVAMANTLAALKPSLEALVDFGSKVDKNNPVQVANFNHVVDAATNHITGITLSNENLEVTMESLSGMLGKVKDFFAGYRKGRTDKAMSIADREKAKRAILEVVKQYKKFYLNDSWLNKQEIAEGTFKPAEPAAIQIAGKVPSDVNTYSTNIKEYLEFASAGVSAFYEHNLKIAAIKKELEVVAKATDAGADEAPELKQAIDKAVAAFRALPNPMVKYNVNGTINVVGNFKLTSSKGGYTCDVTPSGASDAPLLSIGDIKALAGAVVEALDAHLTIFKYMPGAGDLNDDSALSVFLEDGPSDVDPEAWMDITSYEAIEDEYNLYCVTDPLRGFMSFVKTADQWILASIK